MRTLPTSCNCSFIRIIHLLSDLPTDLYQQVYSCILSNAAKKAQSYRTMGFQYLLLHDYGWRRRRTANDSSLDWRLYLQSNYGDKYKILLYKNSLINNNN